MRNAVCFLVAIILGSGRTVVVSPSKATLTAGETQQFSAQLFENGVQKPAAFVWTSSNKSVATVSPAGTVTAVAGGEATITASASRTAKGTAHVTVRRVPPQLVGHVPLAGEPFGSAVTGDGTGWIGQPSLGQVSRLDIAGARFTGTVLAGPRPVQIATNRDGSRLYVSNFGGQVASINTTTGPIRVENSVLVYEDAYGVASSRAGDTVFVGMTRGPIHKVDLRGGSVLGTLDLPVAAGYHFEWNKSRTRLYAAQRGMEGEGRVFEIEPTLFTVLRTFETGGSPQGIQLSSDGSKLFIAAQDGGVLVWDVASNSLVTTYPTPGCNGYGLLRTPDNAFLIVGCVLNGRVEMLDPATGTLLATLNVGGRPRELSYDPVTKSILVPNESGWVDILR